jgi:Dihydroorotase and related cyclic amidohydrolases
VALGVPGIELRMPLLMSEGVGKGRIDIHQFVALTATNAARIYGLAPRKGSIAVGGDADLVLWDREREWTVTHDLLHDNCDYTPYEGMKLTGFPILTLSRGEIVWQDGEVKGEPGAALSRLRPARGAPPVSQVLPVSQAACRPASPGG